MRLLVGICVCSLVCVGVVVCGHLASAQEKPLYPGSGGEPGTVAYPGGGGGEPGRPDVVTLDADLHFIGLDDKGNVVPSGSYRVEIAGEAGIRLIPWIGEATDIKAVEFAHEGKTTRLTASLAVSPHDDEAHIVVLSPGGRGLSAAGSRSGARPRAGKVLETTYKGDVTRYTVTYSPDAGEAPCQIFCLFNKTEGTYTGNFDLLMYFARDDTTDAPNQVVWMQGATSVQTWFNQNKFSRYLDLFRGADKIRIIAFRYSDKSAKMWLYFDKSVAPVQ
jgi:hypothetical protein